MTKNLVRIGVAVLTTILSILVVWQFRTTVIYILISLILAATIRPLFSRLSGRGVIFRLIWIFVYIVGLSGAAFILFLLLKSATVEIQALAKTAAVRDVWVIPLWPGSAIQQTILSKLPSPSMLFQAVIGNEGELALPALMGIAQGIGSFATAGAVFLILSIYWGFNQIHFERLWLSLLPSEQRKRARSVWRNIELGIGGYIRGQLLQSLVAGLLLGFGYWVVGSSYPVLLGLVGALVCLIPVVGPILAIIAPLLVGMFSSVPVAIFTTTYALIVMIAIMAWLKPRLQNQRWDNPILTVILLIALADAFGITGIILAPPLSVVCQVLWYRLVSHKSVSGAATNISDLKARLAALKETISTMEEPRVPLVMSTIERISDLLEEAEPILVVSTEPAAQA